MFLIANAQKGHALLVFGFLNWILAAVAINQICRSLGASRASSIIVTSLALMAPVLIAQGSSEGDDLLATAPFLLALMFFVATLQTLNPIFAIFAGVGFGISLAMKFLPVFYLPALALIGFALLISPAGRRWLVDRIEILIWLGAGLVFSLLPYAVANWAAFGDPLYVSPAISSARNSPFSFECGARAAVGHWMQLIFSDQVRLVAGLSHLNIAGLDIAGYNHILTDMIPFHPIPRCTAYGNAFELTNPYADENTLWFGLLGPTLLVSSVAAIVCPGVPLLVRALAFVFIGWELAFDFATKYYGENGRYFAMAVLAACPIVAVLLDKIRERWGRRVIAPVLIVFGMVTLFNANIVLRHNLHRSLPQALHASRYSGMLSPAAAEIIRRAKAAVNVQVLYGINTYDYYVLLDPVTLYNKLAVLNGAINIVAVRPFGIADNPFDDPRIPVRMPHPVMGAFKFVGGGFGQNMSFANNMELEGASKPSSHYLIFEMQQLKKDKSYVSGLVAPIASSQILPKIHYRIGSRAVDGVASMSPTWHFAPFGEFVIPQEADKLIIEVGFDGSAETATSEWPMRQFLPRAGKEIAEKLREDDL
jgi:hypothetical protein